MTRRTISALVLVASLALVVAATPSSGQESAPAGGETASTAVEVAPAPDARAGGRAYAGAGAEPIAEAATPPAGGVTLPAGGESVIGADGRVQVTPTTGHPSSAIGQIEFDQNFQALICTGWLIDPNTVMTSGHCVSDGAGTWSSNVTFSPGRDGGNNPNGTCGATQLFTTSKWHFQGRADHDWGMIQLNCNVGDTVGWFGYRSLPDGQLRNRGITVRGYPGDKPFGTMWTMNDRIRALPGQSVRYRADTFGGQSGSPVYENSGCGGPCGLAVHSYGCPGGPPCPAPNNHNSGPRLTAARVDAIHDYAAENDPHPDALVRLGSGPFKGDGLYNFSGRNQTISTTVAARGTRNFTVRVQNDGVANDTITVRGTGGTSRYRVRYFVGPTDVTAQVRAGTFTLANLGVGASVDLRVEVKALATARRGSSVTARVTATSADTAGYRDVVKATVRR